MCNYSVLAEYSVRYSAEYFGRNRFRSNSTHDSLSLHRIGSYRNEILPSKLLLSCPPCTGSPAPPPLCPMTATPPPEPRDPRDPPRDLLRSPAWASVSVSSGMGPRTAPLGKVPYITCCLKWVLFRQPPFWRPSKRNLGNIILEVLLQYGSFCSLLAKYK